MRKNLARRPKNRLRLGAIRPINRLPNTHVPVVVCRSAGIWTRGQSTALERPAAGGKPAHPAQRGTRLEATTDRAFLVSVSPPKADNRRGLSFLPGVRKGYLLSKRWLWTPPMAPRLRLVMATAHHLALAAPRCGSPLSLGFVSGRGGGSTLPVRVSNARAGGRIASNPFVFAERG